MENEEESFNSVTPMLSERSAGGAGADRSEVAFLSACVDGRAEEVSALLKSDPRVMLVTDSGGNTGLHLAVAAQRERAVGVLLNFAKTQGALLESTLIEHVNKEGKTALDVSLQRRHRKISWALIQNCGVRTHDSSQNVLRKQKVSTSSILQSLPDFENGNNFLHVFARSNYALQIKDYFDGCEDRGSYVLQCLTANGDGNTPAMVAARRGHKEALLALLQPFIVFPERLELDRLLHHENADGHRLLTYVSHFDKSLVAVQGLLVEMEIVAHERDARVVQECFRHSMGSTMAAKLSIDLLKRIRHRSTTAGKSCLLIKILSISFLVKTLFLVLDMFTDIALVLNYYDLWEKQEQTITSAFVYDGPVEDPEDPCKVVGVEHSTDGNELSRHVLARENVTLGCYPGAIDGKTRFVATISFLLLPFTLYFFELLRFRLFSQYLERRWGGLNGLVLFILKSIGNAFLWVLWPLVAFFRLFWFRFLYETSEGEKHTHLHRRAALISSRAQLIEVCTESSLQPLFQFYLVFQEIAHLKLSSSRSFDGWSSLLSMVSEGLAFVVDAHKRQVASVIISLFVLACSFTMQYRMNKENSMGLAPTVVYFTSVSLLVCARILCFEMFAYSLGPGNLRYALLAAAAHAIAMAALHFVFSDSLAQCVRTKGQTLAKWGRQLFLVAHNCLLNGLANLYVHNNLEIFVQRHSDFSKNAASAEDAKSIVRKEAGAATDLCYVHSDMRQRTLVRQMVFESIILVENVLMLYFAKNIAATTPNFMDMYALLSALAMIFYFVGIALKFAFYLSCHPWAALIRPQPDSAFATSCIVCSRHFNVVLRCCGIRVSSDRQQDARRFRSIRHLLPVGFNFGDSNVVVVPVLGGDRPGMRSSEEDQMQLKTPNRKGKQNTTMAQAENKDSDATNVSCGGSPS